MWLESLPPLGLLVKNNLILYAPVQLHTASAAELPFWQPHCSTSAPLRWNGYFIHFSLFLGASRARLAAAAAQLLFA